MASLANQTISSTYDGLIKTSTDQPVGASGVQLLEDGVGNTLALSVGRANQGATVTGTLTATTLAGTLSTAAQTNITSVGTLSSLTVSGNLTVDTNTLYVDAALNFVGIGTSTQTVNGESLRITGDVFINSTGNATVPSIALADTNSGLFAPSAGNIAFTTQGIERAIITSSGRLGVGTSTPTVQIEAGGISQPRMAIVSTGTTGAGQFHFGDDDSANIGRIRYDHADDSMSFVTNASEKMRIDSSGNVGIGTSAPTEKLQVEGNAEINGIVYMNNGTVADDGRFRFGTGNDYSMGYDSSSDTLRIADGNTLTSNVRLAIDSAGNVGIGTTSPAANLEVNKGSEGLYLQVGGDNASNNRALEFTSSTSSSGSNGALHTINSRSISGEIALATGGSEAMRIDSSGNVGIGTSSPDAALVVSENGASGLEIDPYYNSNSVRLIGYNRSTSTRVPLRFDSDTFIFNDGATEFARITSNGISFNGDTLAVNSLDDYEEGTWTPALQFGGASTGITYSSFYGQYTKIGNIVYFYGSLRLSSKGSATGDATIDGLPFTAGSGSVLFPDVNFRPVTNVIIDNFPTSVVLRTTNDIALLQYNSTTDDQEYLDEGNFSSDSEFTFTGFYYV